MRLRSGDGATVELSVVGYEYPEAIEPEGDVAYDANWLVVEGSVRTAEGRSWSFVDPCLLTWEARELATWLRSVAANDGEPTVSPSDVADAHHGLMNFIEPNLGFSVAARTDAAVHLRVHLSLEASPEPPVGDAGGCPLYSYFVTITLTPADLRAAVEQWERDLEPYPITRTAP